jgi:putative transposase
MAAACEHRNVHLLQKRHEAGSVQLILSLSPRDVISDVLKAIKTSSSTELCRRFRIEAPLWARGYLARSAGRVKVDTVKRYLTQQAEHHGYANRALPPVFRFKADSPHSLAAAHSSFDLTHHLVIATQFRRGVFGTQHAEALVRYWMKVAAIRGFAIDQVTVLPDHIHMLLRITPKISVEQATLWLLNNGQYFMWKNFARAIIEAKVDHLWQPSAYVGTCGDLPTALLKAFLTTG